MISLKASEEVESIRVILLLVCNTLSVETLPVSPLGIEAERTKNNESYEGAYPGQNEFDMVVCPEFSVKDSYPPASFIPKGNAKVNTHRGYRA